MVEGGFQARQAPKRRGRNRERPNTTHTEVEVISMPNASTSNQPVINFDELPVGKSKNTQFIPEFPGDQPKGSNNIMEQPLPGYTKTNPQRFVEDDERPIPTLQKGIDDFEAHIEEQIAKEGKAIVQDNKPKKEKFSKKQLEKIRNLSSEISVEVLEQVFSSNWHTREIGLEVLMQEIDDLNDNRGSLPTQVLNSQNMESVIRTLWTVNNMFLEERISQLIYKGIMMLSKLILLKIDKTSEKNFGDFSRLLRGTIIKILEKLGDYKNETLRDKLNQVVFDMIEADLLSFEEMTDWLMKEKGLSKAINSFKHIIGKLICMKELVLRFEKEVYPTYRSLLGYACKCLENSNAEVRTNASSFIVEIYRIIGGSKVSQYLNQAKIRKNHYENLKLEFEKIDIQSGRNSANNSMNQSPGLRNESLENRPQNSGFQKESKKAKKVTAQKSQKKKANKIGKPCNFCKAVSPDFDNDNEYDMHLWRDCPMLITCEECTQVVEIADFTEHLLDECSNKEQYDECPRCKLSFPIEEVDQHIEDMVCNEVTEDIIKCPMCSEDLQIVEEEYEKTWFNHLILKTCPNNTRMVQ